MANLKEIKIYRFNPDTDKKPYMQTYQLDISTCKGNMVLDGLEAIKANIDASLSFRRSCGEAVCGSDGMNINGRNSLACITRFSELPDQITLNPLPGFPVIRDLVVDLDQFFSQWEKTQPFLQAKQTPITGEFIQTPEQRAQLDGLYECILCACCSGACPSYWWNPDKFLGPAALLWAYRYIADSRDGKTEERLNQLQDAFKLFRCRTIMNCADVCPKGLNPSHVIAKIRAAMLAKAA